MPGLGSSFFRMRRKRAVVVTMATQNEVAALQAVTPAALVQAFRACVRAHESAQNQ